MTFDEIVADVADRLNQTSTAAITRIGKAVNRRYKIVTSAVGLIVGRRTTVQQAVTLGFAEVTFSDIEKVIRVTAPSVSNRPLTEVSYEELMEWEPGTDTPTCYAIARMNARSVTIAINSEPAENVTLYAEGLETKDTLEDDDEPSFSESFHDILVEGALIDEYRRLEKTDLLKISAVQYEARLQDLQLFIAKSSMQSVFPGRTKSNGFGSPGSSGGSGGGSADGSQNYTQTGLITFDRNPLAPFAVVASSAVVPNLNADLLDGLDSTYFLPQSTYEAGSWTPVLGGDGGTSGQTYSMQVGRYVKIGKLVHVQGQITLTTKGTITGNLILNGLPYAAENVASAHSVLNIGYFLAMGTNVVFLSGYIPPAAGYAAITGLTAAAASVSLLTTTNVSNTTSLIFQATYRTT